MAPAPLVIILLALIAIPVGIVAIIYLIVPVFKAIGWLIKKVFGFVFGEIGDALRFVGALITQLFFIPLVVGNVLIGRWSAAAHYGRAFGAEFKTAGACIYRMGIGHPARLLCLHSLVDGIEKRVPQAIAAAPGADKPSKSRTGQFDGYQIVGSLPGGGSGGKLYIANPDAIRMAGFSRAGQADVRQVVIKTFSLKDGSSLPQIVRESRALEAAKRLGLVLDHELNDERFFYVTRYVPGESLGLVTQRLHAFSGSEGLEAGHLRQALGYVSDLLRTLDQYHRGGLWHKDVKPDNIIVDGRAAHLVDFGLVTPLRSGMTLTTHGTEYFRDPEMVRMALKGVKVHQVDGAKFDIYATGAVLFSMIENSFPAHGGLSQIGKRCPEAAKWIVRRAMTEYDRRYTSSAAMLADIEVLRHAPDPFAVRPADLPSMRGVSIETPDYDDAAPIRPTPVAVGVGAGSDEPAGPFVQARAGSPVPPTPPLPPLPPLPLQSPGRSRPKIKVNRWWTGGYQAEGLNVGPAIHTSAGIPPIADPFASPLRGHGGGPRRYPRASAADQLKSAQARVAAARERAHNRMSGRRSPAPKGADFNVLNPGVVAAVAVFLVAIGAIVALLMVFKRDGDRTMVRDLGPNGHAFVAMDLPGFDVIRAAPTSSSIPELPSTHGTILHSKSDRPGPKVIVNGAAVEEIVPVVGHGERILVIAEDTTPGVNAAVDRLRQAGFVVLGNFPGVPGGSTDDEEIKLEITLAAEARAIVSTTPIESEDLKPKLSTWLREKQDLNLLVWFDRTPTSNPDTFMHKCYIFAPALGQDADPAEADQYRAEMLAAEQVIRGTFR
jgi:serine/threonine protein kinase